VFAFFNATVTADLQAGSDVQETLDAQDIVQVYYTWSSSGQLHLLELIWQAVIIKYVCMCVCMAVSVSVSVSVSVCRS
jgi:hypothetical protein